jgi:coenzyme F420-reducing hydrogenase delta subunit
MSKIVIFSCENCVDEIDEKDVKLIKLPCSGRIDTSHILKAIENGAKGVLIFACYESACKFISGNIKTKKRVEYAKKILKEIGIDEDKLQMHNIQINQEGRLREIIESFKNKILGG